VNSIADKSSSMTDALAREIIGGVYRTGMKLPGERKLGDYFKVSRITIRAVLEDFERKGIIIRKPRSGAYIAENAIELLEKRSKDASYRIQFVMPPKQQVNPLMQTIFATFRQYIGRETDASVLFIDTPSEVISELRDADAAVMFSVEPENTKMISEQTKKLIVLNRQDSVFDYITPDNYGGGRMMAEYLLECGHRHICCPLYNLNNPELDFIRRFEGLKDVLAENSLKPETFLIEPQLEFTPAAYAEVWNEIHKRGKATAIACLTDKIAMNMYSQLIRCGLRVPDDISVIGFDDQYYAQFCNPPLTTVKYPAEAMGKALADSLNHFLKNGVGNIRKTIMPVLIKRQSVKPI